MLAPQAGHRVITSTTRPAGSIPQLSSAAGISAQPPASIACLCELRFRLSRRCHKLMIDEHFSPRHGSTSPCPLLPLHPPFRARSCLSVRPLRDLFVPPTTLHPLIYKLHVHKAHRTAAACTRAHMPAPAATSSSAAAPDFTSTPISTRTSAHTLMPAPTHLPILIARLFPSPSPPAKPITCGILCGFDCTSFAVVICRHNDLIPYETSAAAAYSEPGSKSVPTSSARCDLNKPVFQMRDPARDSKAKMLCQIKDDEFACTKDDPSFMDQHVLGFPVQGKQKAFSLDEYRQRWTKSSDEIKEAGQVPCSEHRANYQDFGKDHVYVTIKRPGHVGAWH